MNVKKITQKWVEFAKEDLKNAEFYLLKNPTEVLLGIVIKQLRKF